MVCGSVFHELIKHRTTSVWVTVDHRQTNAWKNLNEMIVNSFWCVMVHVWCFPAWRGGNEPAPDDTMSQFQLLEGSTVISKTVCIWLAEEISTGSSSLSHSVQRHFSLLLYSVFLFRHTFIRLNVKQSFYSVVWGKEPLSYKLSTAQLLKSTYVDL